MTTEGRLPVDGAISPLPPERLREESGLTWPGLAARMAVADRGAIPLRRVERFQLGLGHQGIVALARDLPGGYGLATSGEDACEQDANPDRSGNGS